MGIELKAGRKDGNVRSDDVLRLSAVVMGTIRFVTSNRWQRTGAG